MSNPPDEQAAAGQPPSPAPAVAVNDSAPSKKPKRLMSLDALRGFDMFWIIGADSLAMSLKRISPDGIVGAVADQLDHVPWEGFRFYDMIFPLFVFIIGISVVFSLGGKLESQSRLAVSGQVFRRFLILYVLGLFYYGGISEGVEKIRLLGVLQRLAFCYLAAGLAFIWLRPRAIATVCGGLLVGYWALMTFVPVPGHGAGVFEEGKNLANYVDSQYLPLFKWNGDHDPEGMLSTLPAMGSCLLGLMAGLLLRHPGLEGGAKARILIVGGIASVVVGFLWGLQFPVIKNIWTSSFVLVAGGFSSMLMGLFYYVVDVRNHQSWCQPFVWIGMNSITIYLLTNLVNMEDVAKRLVGGPVAESMNHHLARGAGELLIAAVALGLCLAIVKFLYDRRIFLKI